MKFDVSYYATLAEILDPLLSNDFTKKCKHAQSTNGTYSIYKSIASPFRGAIIPGMDFLDVGHQELGNSNKEKSPRDTNSTDTH